MQPKTKEYLTLFIILFIASLFLIISIGDADKIIGHAVTDIKLWACKYAEIGDTCFTKLPLLDLISPEQCCQRYGKCCPPDNFVRPYPYQPKQNYSIRQIRLLSKGLELPEGYSIIHSPFNVDCETALDLITNIPSNFEDTKILKCKGDKCYVRVIKKTTTTKLGDITIDQTEEIERFEPELIKLKAEEITLDISSIKDIVEKGGAELYGPFFDNIIQTLNEEEKIQEEMQIIGGPFTISKEQVKRPLKLPFSLNKNIHGQAIGLFAKKQDKWISINSNIDEETKAILANIKDISQFEGDNISLAIMGLTIYPTNVTFEIVYFPQPPSADAVILVHGLATTKQTFKYLIEDFQQSKPPFQLWKYDYSSTRYIDEIADDLSDAIEENTDKYSRIFIVAHSMGGIIAQQALYNAHQKGYSYIEKVKKAILIATPNEGSVVAEAYQYLFSTLVHKSVGVHEIFNINEKFVSDLIKGRIIHRVPAIDYYVIAGTRPYTEGLIAQISKKVSPETKFDGVVSVKSAQNIGGEYVDDMCKNYWEVNMTHMELVDDYVSRQIIGKIISEEVKKARKAELGNNKYYKIKVEECSPDIYYLAIGRNTTTVLDATGCSCGDSFCGVGETIYNCPADCAEFFAMRHTKTLPSIFIFIIILIGLSIYVWKKTTRKFKK